LEGWSNNPDDTAYPGAYALFSVIDDHPGIAGTCGGILVQRVREGEYRISIMTCNISAKRWSSSGAERRPSRQVVPAVMHRARNA